MNLKKKEKCREVIRKVRDNYRGVISTQVMQEFFVVATQKLGVDALQVKNIVRQFEDPNLPEVPNLREVLPTLPD
jgi:predicted nucleic acid-binding protein